MAADVESTSDYIEFEKVGSNLRFKPVDQTVVINRSKNEPNTLMTANNPIADYLHKNILDQAIASKYDLSSVPGSIYLLNNDGTFRKISNRIVKNNAYPRVETVNKIYYNDKVTYQQSIGFNLLALQLNLNKNQTSDLIIKDEITTKLPDSLINFKILKNLKNQFSGTPDYDKLYFAEGATLSSITFKKFTEQRFKKNLELSWFTSGGEVYGSNENFNFRSEVALELIKLKDFIIIE